MFVNYSPHALFNDFRSAFGEVEKGSRELLAKAKETQFVDKNYQAEEVARLVEQFRDVITHYQVSKNLPVGQDATHTIWQRSQQQAIYDRITYLSVSVFRFISLQVVLIMVP